ncbi:hypothetical protein AN280_05930 [Pseudomonas aeruginosa]|uniref:hypothetical protein n=1 Tax=Pseudomonas aeruginosa TaxID=287 RepID=UPI000707E21A|nr:hypothetical protein [Pseudomonas aeruginosa]KQJ57557.1 hypothetical protein AN280_05930 [Pseudomonas aeruginosa]MBI8713221.1 hypothetical protein [Pseudomonas aeruginosa]MCO3531815.1 hypothetical protein [Pseudomonas aeruginosa]NPY13668.1 hypothetical protein [Pseudomonas aeruginosa]UGR35414.1 hypothetical protein LSP18_11070 [Pseudomonas aeruginosa]
MSSTQHQLIEQCATRLRGIIEALDNIHDTSPHRWSTDLDDVHSSAESLLALINDQAPPSDAERWREQFDCMQLQRDHHRERADAAPGKEVPQAWLDVQAERRRQVEVEGYHGFRDSHYINYELSKAACAYIEVSWHALSGGLPCKKPESWPWMTGFKWADGRTMLVKAGALILAEIERLDRAAASQGGPSDA